MDSFNGFINPALIYRMLITEAPLDQTQDVKNSDSREFCKQN